MNPIIIGYDGSEGAQGAIAFAGEYLVGRDAIVVTVFEDWPPVVHGDPVDVDAASRARTWATAEEGAALARAAGIRAEARAVFSAERPWRALIEVADELDAGLIVVGSHGFNGLRPLVLGSVSHQLAHHAYQPVIAVPTPAAVAARREQKQGSEEHAHH